MQTKCRYACNRLVRWSPNVACTPVLVSIIAFVHSKCFINAINAGLLLDTDPTVLENCHTCENSSFHSYPAFQGHATVSQKENIMPAGRTTWPIYRTSWPI